MPKNPHPVSSMQQPSLMIRNRVRLLLPACAFLLAAYPAPLRAQASGKPAVEFCCVIWDPLPMSAVFYRNGKNYLPLEFSPGSRSQPYPLKEAGPLELYEKAAGADGASTYKLLGKAPLVAGARQMLFLIDPVPNATGLPLRLFGVNDALDVFPTGTIRFFNFSTAALRVKLGEQVSKLPAGEISVVKSNVSENGGFIPFLIGNPQGETVFETRLFSQPTGRDMVFIGAPAQPGGRALVKVLPQLIAPEPPQPQGQTQSSSP
jgi:hypothetical protein